MTAATPTAPGTETLTSRMRSGCRLEGTAKAASHFNYAGNFFAFERLGKHVIAAKVQHFGPQAFVGVS